jgi:hypothetical protein
LEYSVSKLIEILYFWQCYERKYHSCMHTAPENCCYLSPLI